MLIRYLTVLLILSITACGFHLRGMMPTLQNLENIFISTPNEAKYLRLALERELKVYNVRICSTPNQAFYELIVDNVELQRQVSNISSSTTPRQYQLIYKVYFHVIDTKQSHTIIPAGKLTANRLVTMNNERLLGSNYEQDFFVKEMQEELARQILTSIVDYHDKALRT